MNGFYHSLIIRMLMFNDLNEVKLLGNMTNDPELKFTPSGTAVLNFSMATNRRYKQGDEWKDEVAYHNVVVWGNLAQGLATRAKKGTRLLTTRSWDYEGKKQYKTEVVASDVYLIDRFQKDIIKADQAEGQSQAPAEQQSFEEEVFIGPDTLPF